MEEDQALDPGPDQSGRALKRKKTVTWADDDDLEVPLAGGGGTPGSIPAAGAPSPRTASQQQAQQKEAAVVVLPCDGLYDALTLDLLDQQEDAPEPAGEEPLTRRQLLERRLAHTEQLSQLYRSELWALLEELRLRHSQFVAQPGRNVWKEGRAAAAAAAAAAGEREEGKEEAEKEGAPQPARKRQKHAAGGQAGAKPAAAAAGEAEGGEQQQQQAQASSPSAAAAEGQAEPGSEPGSALRDLWERQQRGEQPPAEGGQQAEGKGKEKAQSARKGRQGKAAAKREQQAPAEKKRTRRQEQQEAAQAAAGKGGEVGTNGAPQDSKQEADKQAEASEKQQAQQATPPPPPLLPRFEDIEQLLLGGAAAGLPAPNEAALLAARSRFVQRLSLVGRLEQSALAATCRELDSLGGLALLCGRRRRYVLRRAAVALGRCTESQGKVDVDLSAEVEGGGSAQRVSRQQAQLFLDAAEGGWRLRCTGRRGMLVNGAPVAQGQTAALPTLSHIAVGGVSLLFAANTAATARALGRSGALLAA